MESKTITVTSHSDIFTELSSMFHFSNTSCYTPIFDINGCDFRNFCTVSVPDLDSMQTYLSSWDYSSLDFVLNTPLNFNSEPNQSTFVHKPILPSSSKNVYLTYPVVASHSTFNDTCCLSPFNVNNNNMSLPGTATGPVINLSSFQLTPAMISLLSKGLNFCPTPGEPDRYMLRKDLDKFHVNLRRKLFFSRSFDSTLPLATTLDDSLLDPQSSNQVDPFEHFKFKNPSSWCPKGPPPLETMITVNEHLLNSYPLQSPFHQNLSLAEKEALAELTKAPNIVIKPADKGSAVVIQNRLDYVREGLRQLSDPNFYMLSPTDLTHVHNDLVHKLVSKLHTDGEIGDKCKKYLCIDNVKTPQLYLLPKIHKNKLPVPGRPIVSANNSPTERISQLADHFLQPLLPHTRSYIRDTTDFINHIEALAPLSANSILCTVDVASLYTNIPNHEGISACEQMLSQHRPRGLKPSNSSIATLLEYVLYMNNFDFNDLHYLQIGGTAMGTKVAPSFANIFMADFEDKWVYNYPLQPTIWLRYIDDIFMIWDHGEDTLQAFLHHLNTCHKTIKFTSETSTTEVNFLDTTVKVDQNRTVYTDLYCKPTDSHNYLLYDSAHPKHLKDSLPYSQLLRIKRICTKPEDFERNAIFIATHFKRRGYPADLIEEALLKVYGLGRVDLLHPPNTISQPSEMDKLFLVSPFHPLQSPLKDIVNDTWSLLGRNLATDNLYSKRITFGNRRAKNLKDTLVHAKLPPTKPKRTTPLAKTSAKTCKARVECRYCTRLNTTGTIISHSTGKSYTSMINVTCNSNNLIYCICCKTCQKQYVGQTLNSIKERFKCHFTCITAPDLDNPIGRHFHHTNNHKGLQDVEIHVLAFINAPDRTPAGQRLRDEKERTWIHRLSTLAPFGLNLSD